MTGSTFIDGESVTLNFGGVTRNIAVSGTSWSTSVVVPSIAGPTLTVTATGTTSGQVSTTFTVIATAQLSGTTGAVGSTVNVTGEGFPASQQINITFDGTNVRNASTGGNGNLNTSFTVPPVAAGNYNVNVGSSLTFSFRVSSSFTISPSSGPPGTPVQILGTGFAPISNVDLTIGGTAWQTVTADSEGTLRGNLQIPPVSGGSKTINVSGGSASSQTNFEVTPTLTVDQPTAAPGDTVNVSATAFRANESGITVKFDSTTVATGITADGQGRWTASFEVPSTTAGGHNLTASGISTVTNVPTARLTIGAGISLERGSGPPGALVKISGSGARRNEAITINVGNGLAIFEASANTRGVWESEITIPPAPRGSLSINASGSNTEGASTTFNVTPTMILSEPNGSPGSVILVRGEGFRANQSGITITFDDDIVTAASSNSQGSWSTEVTIPPAKKGTYFIKASGGGSDQQAPFSVAPGLFINKAQAGPGETATVSGGGFAPNETGIVLRLGDATIATGITANADGSWNTSFVIPPLPANSYNLTASGAQTSAGSVQERVLTLTTRLTLSATSGSPGEVVVINGQGFNANEQNLSISYDNTVLMSGISTDSFGAFTRSIEIPPSTAGQHSIVIGGSSTGVSSGTDINFQVQPGFLLPASNGPSGVNMDLKGTGFGPNEQNIEIKFGSQIVASGLSADANGSFETSFLIPALPAGVHQISSSSSSGSPTAQSQKPYTVVPNITLSQTGGSVGLNLSVIGTGFTPDSDVTLSYDDLAEQTVIADGSGSFNLQLVVPESSSGDHAVKAVDDRGNRVQKIFEVEGVAPDAPVLRSPDNGGRGGLLGNFKPSARWTPVEDPSGVTYNVQIASDPDFLDIVVDKKGLPSPTYKLTSDEALPRGKYYWRVQAVDRAANAGPFSSVHEFNSGIIPIWLLSAMVVLGLIASGGGAYAYYTRVYLPKKMAQQAPVFPDFVRISRPEIAAPAQSPAAATSAPALSSPRRALPSPFRRGGTGGGSRGPSISPEQQARLQMVVDFVSSIPLMEVSPDLLWIEELAESLGGSSPDIFEQILRGDLEPVYQPAWMQHPTYQSIQAEPSAAPFLEGLEVYIESVNDCAADVLSVLRRIYGDLEAAGSLEVLGDQQWRYVMAIGRSTISWYRGTYLGQPSPREYAIEPGASDGLSTLVGSASCPFSGPLLEGLHEEDLVFYRDLHIQLRNTYRNDDEAREVAAKMTATGTMRDQLTHNITQMGEQAQGR